MSSRLAPEAFFPIKEEMFRKSVLKCLDNDGGWGWSGGRETGLLANLYISEDFVSSQAETLLIPHRLPDTLRQGEEPESAASRLLN